MFEIEGDIAGGLEAILGILLQAMLHDSLERRRDIAIRFDEIRRILFQDGAHRVGGGVAAGMRACREHLVEDCAEAEDVGAGVDRMCRAPARATCSRRCPSPVPLRRDRYQGRHAMS